MMIYYTYPCTSASCISNQDIFWMLCRNQFKITYMYFRVMKNMMSQTKHIFMRAILTHLSIYYVICQLNYTIFALWQYIFQIAISLNHSVGNGSQSHIDFFQWWIIGYWKLNYFLCTQFGYICVFSSIMIHCIYPCTSTSCISKQDIFWTLCRIHLKITYKLLLMMKKQYWKLKQF